MNKRRGCIRVSFTAIEHLLSLQEDSIRAIISKPEIECIEIYHDDKDKSIDYLEFSTIITKAIGKKDLGRDEVTIMMNIKNLKMMIAEKNL